MADNILSIEDLPAAPLAAAVAFHAQWLAQAETMLADGDLVLVMSLAGHEHRAWRLAAVQGLARAYAPARANLVECDEPAGIAAACAFLAASPGITGQILRLDSQAPGAVID
ncbi:Rossmann fold domain-containing protein [Novosphingobium sediminicola]|uniref:Short chain dehydrogenase-like proteobacteria domain-containing protein n=1 Tax=Novosphingobium sediminicola TaxID=563162 RepID=A0A7W6G7B9_9SPHN|nr:hypothetical protein [Novosphingobium sediminicola]